MTDTVMKELIQNMTDMELKTLQRQIEATLSGDLESLNLDPASLNIYADLNEYLKAKRIEGKTEATLKQYNYSLSAFLKYVNKPPHYIRTNDIRNYLDYKKQTRHNSDLTLENQRININTFFEWLKNNGYTSTNPCALIAPIKFEKKEREPLTDLEMEQLRLACETTRDKAMIEVLYSTGCRISELVGIKLSDISIEKKEIIVFGKGRKYRTVYLNARALVQLSAYLAERKGTSEYLFVSERAPYRNITSRTLEIRIHNLGERAGIKGGVFPHRIRHTTATDALNRGMPIEQVQLLLGHENVTTTQIYAKSKKEQVKAGHEKYII